jgi:hypothetical protein
MSINRAHTHYCVFDNRTRCVLWTGVCERALLAEQESTHDGNESHMVARALRQSYKPDELEVDNEYRVCESTTGNLAEETL